MDVPQPGRDLMPQSRSQLPSGTIGVPDDNPPWWEQQKVRIKFGYGDHTLQAEILTANHEVLCSIENLRQVPAVYQALFHRTRRFAATVRDLVAASTAAQAPYHWAIAACLLIDWSVDVVRHKKIEFETFLHSQRESIYWILDDALLRILIDQWEDSTSSIPWDVATAPLRIALTKVQPLISEWADQDFEEKRKWNAYMCPPKEIIEDGYFKLSRRFLLQSTRIHEIWWTVRVIGKGQLPNELANVIVEDVSKFEELPTEKLRTLYFPKGKGKDTDKKLCV